MSLGAHRRRPPMPGFVANELWRRAGEVPSFHIVPARTGNARDLITGSVLGTYNSASPAWAVGPDGVLALPAANAPVIDYDPVTLACLGARIWGVTANLRIQSEAFIPTSSGGAWAFLGGDTATQDQAMSPANTLTADLITEGATSGIGHGIGQFNSFTSGVSYTSSIFAKEYTGAKRYLSFIFYPAAFGSFKTAIADVATGQFYSVSSGVTVGSQLYANGFRRVWATCDATTTTTAEAHIRITSSTTDTSGNQLGNSANGMYLWGAQVNPGTIAPYVPTTTLAASSTADVWDITSLTAGINNLKTLYFRGRTAASGTRGIASLNDNTANNRLELSTSGTTAKAMAVTSGSTVADLSGGTIAANTTFRLAVRLDADSYALSLDGGAVVTDTSGARALVDRLFIGRDQAGNYMNGYIEEMAGWTKPCADGQLSALAAS